MIPLEHFIDERAQATEMNCQIENVVFVHFGVAG